MQMEHLVERAAIMEIDGELPREHAERLAAREFAPDLPVIAQRLLIAAIELGLVVEPARYWIIWESVHGSLKRLGITGEAYQKIWEAYNGAHEELNGI